MAAEDCTGFADHPAPGAIVRGENHAASSLCPARVIIDCPSRRLSNSMMTFRRQIEANLVAGPHFERGGQGVGTLPPPVRLIAFYLPQYHPIPENDIWWGKGFTEWTNVSKALPRFVGHYQPRLPSDLGFYDLRLPAVIAQQAELARHYGIHGFCFHYYWFGGRKILQTPLETLLAHPEIDLPFCINWANENWTRTWQGNNEDVLLHQRYLPGEEEAFVADLEPALRDPRYIRINDRPLVMVYRPNLLPDSRATMNRWRDAIRARGLGDPFLLMAQGTGADPAITDPRLHDLDGAAEFPPHRMGFSLIANDPPVPLFDRRFRGSIREYGRLVAAATAAEPAPFKRFPGVCPSWDNEARKPLRGFVFNGSTPAQYGAWLRRACQQAANAFDGDERLVFVNAWNEWGEGAYLEPDRHFGHAYLAETARVLRDLSSAESLAAEAPMKPHEPRGGRYGGVGTRLRVKTHEVLLDLVERLNDPPQS